MRAKDILDIKGREVVTISPNSTLGDAIGLLAERNIGAVVVTDGKRPVGILSERDVVRILAGAPTGSRDHEIKELMTTDLVTAGEGASIDTLKDLMTDRRIRHIPIVEGGELVGVLSIGDVVKHRIREARQEAEALKGYIQG